MRRRVSILSVVVIVLTVGLAACAKKPAPAVQPAPPPVSAAPSASTPAPPSPPQQVEESLPVAQQPVSEDAISSRSLDDLNRDSPFKPAFFSLDSAELDDTGRAVVGGNAAIMRKYP